MTASMALADRLLEGSFHLFSKNIRYTLLTTRPSRYDAPSPDNHAQWVINRFYDHTSAHSSIIESIFGEIQSVADVQFTQVDEAQAYDADISYITSTDVQSNSPGLTIRWPITEGVRTGDPISDIWISDLNPSFTGDSYTPRKTILHETLHGIGVGAGWETYYGNFPIWFGPDDRYGVMSPKAGIDGRPAEHIGIYDIYVVQALYGANWSHELGATVYSFASDGEFELRTIWDAGGTDRIDASNQAEQVVIDLRQGTLSDINSTSGSQYNIGIALGAVIEDATGSSFDDVIIGNAASNHLVGGEGDDWLYGDGTAFARNRPLSSGLRLDQSDGQSEFWLYPDRNGGRPSETQVDRLEGGAGNDKIYGGSAFNLQYGGEGDDILVARGVETHMYGGAGADEFRVGANTWIEDAEAGTGDIVRYGGVTIFGGAKQWWMEGNTAFWAPFSTVMSGFPVIGGAVLTAIAFFVDVATMKFAKFRRDDEGNLQMNVGWGHGGTAAIKNYQLDFDTGIGSAGVTVFETGHAGEFSLTNLQKFVNIALKAGGWAGLLGFDPLVLDLDGDGFELTTEGNSRAYFEFDNDGFGERTGWVRGDDGLLARDADGNGLIDNVTELFGSRTQSGFAALGAFDVNADGLIDIQDAVFSELRVWRDADQDGVTDAGELKTLAELGIVSISLASAAPAQPTAIGGNAILRTGTFTRADGTSGSVGDVAFAINETATRWLGDSTVSASAAALPQLRGFGELKDLRVAMTGDAALEALVSAFAAGTSNDLAALKADAEAILYAWAGVAGVAPVAIGEDGFDARKLAFLEKYAGLPLMARGADGAVLLQNVAEMEALWADQLTRLTLRLVVQGPMAEDFAGISYRADLDLLVAETPTALEDLYAGLLAGLSGDPAAALAEWQAWAPLLGAMADGMRRFDANLVRGDYIAAQLLAAADGVVQPLDFATLAGALGLENLRIGTSAAQTLSRGTATGTAIYAGFGGDDLLSGGAGQDVYVFARQIGHVTIADEENKPAGDRIRFAFLTPGEVKLERSGNDLLITVTATGETVRVLGQFAPVVPLASDVLLSSDKGVEEIQFADGSVWEMPEIMTAVGTGTDFDDHMIGTMHSDVLIGGLGNDRLEGGDDADLYTLTESSSRQAKVAIEHAAPSAKVDCSADHGGTARLRALAENADLFVMTTLSAKHAATDFIRERRGDRPLLYAQGRGFSSILRAIEDHLMGRHQQA